MLMMGHESIYDRAVYGHQMTDKWMTDQWLTERDRILIRNQGLQITIFKLHSVRGLGGSVSADPYGW
jgi:hypothetical protein